jgi:hypothetical protein
MKSPFGRRKLPQSVEPLDHFLGGSGECFHYLQNFSLGVLGSHGERNQGDERAEERDREKLRERMGAGKKG